MQVQIDATDAVLVYDILAEHQAAVSKGEITYGDEAANQDVIDALGDVLAQLK